MQSMTYGTLPTFEHFEGAFDTECPSGYQITLGQSDSRTCDGLKLGDGNWSCAELWTAIAEIIAMEPDQITVSEDEEWENVYQIFWPGTDRPYLEIGPDADDLIAWASKFSEGDTLNQTRAIEALNYAAAYGSVGQDCDRKDAAMDLVSGIMGTLGFEWI